MGLEGLGTELGILNLFLLAIGAASAGVLFKRIQIVMTTEWRRVLRQHNKMWKEYVKRHSDDTGNFEEID